MKLELSLQSVILNNNTYRFLFSQTDAAILKVQGQTSASSLSTTLKLENETVADIYSMSKGAITVEGLPNLNVVVAGSSFMNMKAGQGASLHLS